MSLETTIKALRTRTRRLKLRRAAQELAEHQEKIFLTIGLLFGFASLGASRWSLALALAAVLAVAYALGWAIGFKRGKRRAEITAAGREVIEAKLRRAS